MTDVQSESFWKVPDPRGLLGQTRAVALMRSDKRASYKHFALVEFHWGWAHKDYDWTSLASVRRMHAELMARDPLGGKPMSLQHINSGNRDLCNWGWIFELEKGAGRNASRFLPNFALFDVAERGYFSGFLSGSLAFSVHPVGVRKGFEISVHPMGDSSVTYKVNTNSFSVHPLGDEDLLTGTVLKDGPTESRNDCAPASPPPTVGHEATAAEGAQGGFGDLFKSYYATTKGHAGSKAKARAAYEKMNVSPDLHAEILASAREWHDAWAAQGKPDAPRMHLATWLERQEFENNPPTAFKPKERKERPAKQKSVAANDNRFAKAKPDFTIHPARSTFGVIESAKVYEFDDDGAKSLEVVYRIDEGATVEQFVVFESPDPVEHARGVMELRALEAATGVPAICDNADSALSRRVALVVSGAGERVKLVSLKSPSG